jgi:hypothetical protein
MLEGQNVTILDADLDVVATQLAGPSERRTTSRVSIASANSLLVAAVFNGDELQLAEGDVHLAKSFGQPAGSDNIALLELGFDGKIRWADTFGAGWVDQPLSLSPVDAQGRFFLSGFANQAPTQFMTGVGPSRTARGGFVVRYQLNDR